MHFLPDVESPVSEEEELAQPSGNPGLLWDRFLEHMIVGPGDDDQINGYDGDDMLNGADWNDTVIGRTVMIL